PADSELSSFVPRSSTFFSSLVPSAVSPLSLHDALPISFVALLTFVAWFAIFTWLAVSGFFAVTITWFFAVTFAWFFAVTITWFRSEEHTSELQSRFDLVCRLLLEKQHNMYV